ncbi:MAG TPA: NrfD/PsrC family molybdoenzyme membrane anchor subunit [Micromonosporaceae bacterium]
MTGPPEKDEYQRAAQRDAQMWARGGSPRHAAPEGGSPPGDRRGGSRPEDRGRGWRDEPGRSAVPPARFRSYYGRPIVKKPVWREDIPSYFYTGGLAAGCAMMAAGADATGLPGLRRACRTTSLGAVGLSTFFLIRDLGMPSRFHHMLRVAKPTSPMSVGTWILSMFGPAAGLAAAAEAAHLLPERGVSGAVRRLLPGAGRIGGYTAAAIAPALATYTAVLIADTAVPSWHEAYPEMPFVFAGSALGSASGLGLLAAPIAETGPARRVAVAGAAIELAAARTIETRLGLLSEPYREGRAGRLLRAGRNLTALGVAGALLGTRSRVATALSGAALLVAPALTRFGLYYGGVASAEDPKYTVVPQRDRLAREGPASATAEPPELFGVAGMIRTVGARLRRDGRQPTTSTASDRRGINSPTTG